MQTIERVQYKGWGNCALGILEQVLAYVFEKESFMASHGAQHSCRQSHHYEEELHEIERINEKSTEYSESPH